jgi:glycosyltransferase involved in cell wall biosynthesis
MLTIAAYSLDLPAYACARLRLLGPASALRGQVEMRWAAVSDGKDYAIDSSAMAGADIIIFQRYFPMKETWPIVEQALSSGRSVVYDVDDNFLAVPKGHPMRERLAPVEPFARELLARADLVTVSTPELKRAFAGVARKVEVLPNFLEERLWSGQTPNGSISHPVRIVFAGTPTHGRDMEIVLPALSAIKGRFGSAVAITFMGCSLPGIDAAVIPFNEDYAGYAAALKELAPDIGLAPLEDNSFNRCKSAVKWLEYSALGAAGVYSDLPPYMPVRHGETGLKAGRDPGDWERALIRLVEDAQLRKTLGRQASAVVRGRWGLAAGAEGYFKVWKQVAHAGG